MSFKLLPAEPTDPCGKKSRVLVSVKSVEERQATSEKERRKYAKQLISAAERKLDESAEKAGPVGCSAWLSELSKLDGYNVPPADVVQILRDHYEPDYTVSTRTDEKEREIVDIAINPAIKREAKQPAEACCALF